MTDSDNQNTLLPFMKSMNAKFYYKKFLDAIKGKNEKAIEESHVFNVLHRMISIENPMKHELKVERLYRCRIIRENDWKATDNGICFAEYGISGFDKYNSKEPPIGVAPSGRANMSGTTILYVSDNPYTACAEVRPRLTDCISVGIFKVCKPMTIIDFSEDQNVSVLSDSEDSFSVAKLLTNVMVQFASPVSSTDDYIVTQYIADYIRKHGIDGICYKSSLTNGKNYAIFNCAEDYIQFVSSSIYYCHNISYDFIDINEEKKCIQKSKSPEEETGIMCQNLRHEIESCIANRKNTE